jgi:hypothetical protein
MTYFARRRGCHKKVPQVHLRCFELPHTCGYFIHGVALRVIPPLRLSRNGALQRDLGIRLGLGLGSGLELETQVVKEKEDSQQKKSSVSFLSRTYGLPQAPQRSGENL